MMEKQDYDQEVKLLQRNISQQLCLSDNSAAMPSEYADRYYTNLGFTDGSDQFGQQRNKIKQSIRSKVSFDDQYEDYESLKIRILEMTSNYQCLLLNVIYGCFSIKLWVLNVEGISLSQFIDQKYSGKFSDIYHAFSYNQDFAIKSNKYDDTNFQQILYATLKQLLFFKICQCLQSGPQMKNAYGFDLLIFSNSIEFTMQYCSQKLDRQYNIQGQLREALRKLHYFHIIHMDIKPDNICYSKGFEKYIFIDFGLSKVVNHSPGCKIHTSFQGTLSYCYKQLADCFVRGQGYADLYYNDSYALKESIAFINSHQSESFIVGNEQIFNMLNRHEYLFILIKYILLHVTILNREIYDQRMKINPIDLLQKSSQLLMQNEQAKIISFLLALPYSKSMNNTLRDLQRHYPNIKTAYIKKKMQNKKIFLESEVSQIQTQKNAFYQRRSAILKCSNNKNDIDFIDPRQYHQILASLSESSTQKDQVYLYMFAVNTQIFSFHACLDKKIQFCKIFLQKYKHPITDKADCEELLTLCFRYIINWALRKERITINTIRILQQIFPSVILLEIYSQIQLINIFTQLIAKAEKFLIRLGLYLVIIKSIDWITLFHAPYYNYYHLTEIIYQIILNQKRQQLESYQLQPLQMMVQIMKIDKLPIKSIIYNTIFKQILTIIKWQLILFQKTNIIYKFVLIQIADFCYRRNHHYRFIGYRLSNMAEIMKSVSDYQVSIQKMLTRSFFVRLHILSERQFEVFIGEAENVIKFLSPFRFHRKLQTFEEVLHQKQNKQNQFDGQNQLLDLSKITIYNLSLFQMRVYRIYQLYQNQINYDLILKNSSYDLSNLKKSIEQLQMNKYFHEHDESVFVSMLLTAIQCIHYLCIDYKINYSPHCLLEQIRNIIEGVHCLLCKFQCLMKYNVSLLHIRTAKKQLSSSIVDEISQQSLVTYFINLLKQQQQQAVQIIIYDICLLLMERYQKQSKYNYLRIISYWLMSSGSYQKIKWFYLNKNSHSNFVQVEVLFYLWEIRNDQDNQKDFFYESIRVICSNIYDLSDYSLVTRRFCLMIGYLTQKVNKNYSQFFTQNYEYIISRKSSYANCSYIALYLALLALETDVSNIQIKDFFYYFIWSKYETLNELGKKIINTSLYRTLNKMDSISKVRNRDRKVMKIRKMQIRADKQKMISFVDDHSRQSLYDWMNLLIRKLKNARKRNTFQSCFYLGLERKIKRLFRECPQGNY